MNDWAKNVVSKLDERDRARAQAEELRLLDERDMQLRAANFWRELAQSAKRGVAHIMEQKHPQLKLVSFENVNMDTFRGRNPEYPAVIVKATNTPLGIEFTYTRTASPESHETEDRHFIKFSLDEGRNLRLTYEDRVLVGIEEVLNLILGPILRL